MGSVIGNAIPGNVTQMLEWTAKQHFGNKVHVILTLFINDLAPADVASGWSPNVWKARLEQKLA